MNDKDEEVLNRFHLYSQRFLQYSVAEEVYHDTLAYIKQLIKERDKARQMFCKEAVSNHIKYSFFYSNAKALADELGWDCFKEDTDD